MHTTVIGLLLGNPVDALLLRNFFTELGYGLRTAGPDGTDVAELGGSSLIITDEIRGYRHVEALMQAKREADPVLLPVLVLIGARSDSANWIRQGFDDVIRMPVVKAELMTRLETFLRLREESRRTHLESEQRFHTTFDQAPIGIAHVASDGRIVLANQTLCTMLGYRPEELAALRTQQLIFADDIEPAGRDRRRLMDAGTPAKSVSETRFLRKDGGFLWAELTTTAVRDEQGEPRYLIEIVNDIGERKRLQKLVDRITRARRLMAECNHVLVHATDETLLLRDMCRLAVGEGGYRTAWIDLTSGVADSLSHPVIREGDDDGCLQALEAAWLADSSRGPTPMQSAISSGKPCLITGSDDPQLSEWRRSAGRCGAASVAALPLIAAGRALGGFCLYASVADAFGKEEMALLSELASDIAFGIDTLRTRRAMEQMQQALQESERFAHATIDALFNHICVLDQNGTILAVNKAWRDFALLNNGGNLDGVAEGQNYLAVCDRAAANGSEEAAAVARAIRDVIAGSHGKFALEYPCHNDAGQAWFLVRISRFSGDGPVRVVVTHENVTERHQQLQRIARLSRVQVLLSGINSAIVHIHDRQQLFEETCRIAIEHGAFQAAFIALRDSTGKIDVASSAGFVRGFFDRRGDAVDSSFAAGGVLARAIAQGKTMVDTDIQADPDLDFVRREAVKHGSRSAFALPLLQDDRAVGAIVLYSDATTQDDAEELEVLEELAGDVAFAMDHIAKEEKLNYLAYNDALTGLSNETLLYDRLGQNLRAAQRNSRMSAMILLDIERFHEINDTLGRAAGDSMLKEVAVRLRSQVRADDTVARVGADRFAVALSDIRDPAEIAHFALDRLVAELGRPVELHGRQWRLSVRIGAALYPADADAPETLFANAEIALKKAKTSGDRLVFYSAEMNTRMTQSLLMENKLRVALEQEQFVLHYQPKVSARGRKLVGLEALIRWNDPESGLVPPARFIPLLEETGLILEVGRWALAQVARDCGKWVAHGVQPPPVAVNISALQLRQKQFIEDVIEAADATREAGGMLDLEITESVIMENIESITSRLKTIHGLGVNIAIDDFGTGYSSLAYITHLPIQTLKIDRGFVEGMTGSDDNLTIVRTIVSLAHSLRLSVVAEGVETDGQAELLGELGCDELQGYLISKPVPPDQVPELCRKFGR